MHEWVSFYLEHGITFVPLPDPAVPGVQGYHGEQVERAYAVYEWLKHSTFDVVHGTEWCGHLYYALLARRQGHRFSNTTFCLSANSPTLWNIEGNLRATTDMADIAVSHLEQRCVELADIVVSPSQYMLCWMSDHGYQLGENRVFVHPHVMLASSEQQPVDEIGKTTELVFFGRLEARKGLHLFCEALKVLNETGIKVTFLGKLGHVGREPARQYIERQIGTRFDWRVHANLSQGEALDYLAQPGRTAVIPSLVDNSPYVVYECLGHRIPFIASDVGGIGELVSGDECLFQPTVASLSTKLQETLSGSVPLPRPAFDFIANNDSWLAWHSRDLSADSATPEATASPLVTVCIPTRNRHRVLDQALRSLRAQTYRHLEVIVVDDGSDEPDTVAYLERLQQSGEVVLLRQPRAFQAAARNHAASRAKGEYLLFMDDDNLAKPGEIEKLIETALSTGADAVSCFYDAFSGDGETPVAEFRYTPIGDAIGYGLLQNGFADCNTLVSNRTFEALNGFTDYYALGRDDHEFLARLVLSGYRLEIVPEALFWYRHSEQRARRDYWNEFAGRLRVLQPYLSRLGATWEPLMIYAISLSARYEQEVGATLGSDAARLGQLSGSTIWRALLPLRLAESLVRGRRLWRVDSLENAEAEYPSIQRSLSYQVFNYLREQVELRREAGG